MLGDVRGLDVLEFGCGDARVVGAPRAATAPAVVALDQSAGQLRHAAAVARRDRRRRVALVCASAEAVPLAAGSFDLVICDHGAMSFCDPDRTVARGGTTPAPRRAPRVLAHDAVALPRVELRRKERVGRRLRRSYFGMRRFDDGAGEGTVDFQLPYGEWIRCFRRHGLVVDDLVELRAPKHASTSYDDFDAAGPGGGRPSRSGSPASSDRGAHDSMSVLVGPLHPQERLDVDLISRPEIGEIALHACGTSSRKLAYVSQFGVDGYARSKPYAARTLHRHRLEERCTRGRAMNPKTVRIGHVRTRVCLRGSDATVSIHRSKRCRSVPSPRASRSSRPANRWRPRFGPHDRVLQRHLLVREQQRLSGFDAYGGPCHLLVSVGRELRRRTRRCHRSRRAIAGARPTCSHVPTRGSSRPQIRRELTEKPATTCDRYPASMPSPFEYPRADTRKSRTLRRLGTVLDAASAGVVGECGSQQGPSRPTHELGRVVAREPCDVGEPHEASIPVALRMARARRWTVALGHVLAEGASASSIHVIPRPCRSGSCARSTASASSERRSIVRCCASFSIVERLNASMTSRAGPPRRRVRLRAAGTYVPVSGWAATSSARRFGK